MRQVSHIPVADGTLGWAAEAAYGLSNSGLVGLGTLLKSLSSPEVHRWFLDTQNNPTDLGQLLKMLRWILRFACPYAISESMNKINLETELMQKSTIWIEARTEYFERYEHQVISVLLEAAVEDAVRTIIGRNGDGGGSSRVSVIIHLFPLPSVSGSMPDWIKATSPLIRHIGVHSLQPERPLNPLLLSWATESSNVWIAGKVRPLKDKAHRNWLDAKEIEVINNLDYGNLWAKSNETGKNVITRLRHSEDYLSIDDKLRRESSKRRQIMPVRQMSSALDSIADSDEGEHGVYAKLCVRETLRLGWFRIAQNVRKDSHGVDNVTVSMFKDNLEAELSKLADQLESREYRCKPLRRIDIAKPDGGKRSLGIACIRDRVVQTSCLLLLEPLFEPDFSHYSFAFRPRRSAHQALAIVTSRIAAGRLWAVIADIKKCFDSIDHSVLLHFLSKRVGDQDLLNLVRHWLTVDVLDFHDLLPTEIGIPQGESLSPLFANVYLNPLDKHFEALGLDFVRYADDIIILTEKEEGAQKALQIMENYLLDPLHLQLKPAKTHFVSLDDGFDFLGFRIDRQGIEIKHARIEEAQEMLRTYVKTLGSPVSTLQQRADSLMRINAVIRGWRNYFSLPDEKHIKEQLRVMDGNIEQMAGYYLPASVRDDPAWICRERFTLPKTIEELETERETAEREVKTGGGYPREDNRISPHGWMVKDKADGEEERDAKKSSAVIEDWGDEKQSAEGNTKDSLLEEAGRLYVLTHGSYLTVSEHDLVIKKRKTEIYRRPLADLGLLYLQGYGMNISVNLQLRLAELDIPAVFALPVGEPMAILSPISSSKSTLRGLQVVRRDDSDVVTTGLNMIASKMGNQAAVLKYFSKYRKKTNPDLGWQLTEAAQNIRELANRVRHLDPASSLVRSSAMGFEGHAAAVYWGRLVRLIPTAFAFGGRVTGSATDPVNQCLNYTYGILYGEVWRAIVKAGLDPYFGLMHGSKRDQGSLVFDLIEEFRAPFADRLVVGMLGRGFQPEIGEHGLLKTKTRKQLATAFIKRWLDKIPWRSRTINPASLLMRQARDLARLFSHEGSYHPFKMKW
jgi:group II intron reverse transcriptase/maturase/CRISPR-associated endonuclease Cas1